MMIFLLSVLKHADTMWRVGLISPNAAVSEVPNGVGAAGSGFEVSLVRVGFLLVAEGDGGFNVPRSKR